MVALRVVLATVVMLAIAAILYGLSRGHIFLLPFVLILGMPLAFFTRSRPPSDV